MTTSVGATSLRIALDTRGEAAAALREAAARRRSCAASHDRALESSSASWHRAEKAGGSMAIVGERWRGGKGTSEVNPSTLE